MNTITAILVDDEIPNLKGLRKKMEKLFPEIKILNCYQKPEEAITAINNNQPNILFLDIQMPRINGFELLSQLKEIDFQIIFVTAYSEYAIAAFKKSAIDYILKPIDNDDLIIAVNKAITNIKSQNENENNTKLIDFLSKEITQNNTLLIPTVKGVSFIKQNEILYLEGYKGYTKIHLEDKTIIISSYNIGKFENQLSTQFFKCHKSYIVNLSFIKQFEKEGYILLTNDFRLPVSKANRNNLISLFDRFF